MSAHYRNECQHGTLAGQCRCPGPKAVRIVPCPPSCVFGRPPSRTENVEGHEHTGWGSDGMNDCEGCADEYWAKVASRTENVEEA